jgi:hypothetical protein
MVDSSRVKEASMNFSILPILLIGVFAFCFFITRRAKKHQSINTAEARSVYFLLLAFFIWLVISVALGIKGIHASPSLMERIPLLWQANVPIAILAIYLFLSRNLRSGLRGIAAGTPWHWLVFFQALRIGALGGVMKGIKGEITSSFVFWAGIPDFLYGISAIIVGWLLLRKAISNRALMIWNLIGPAIILLPTFLFMNYFMNEPGFIFIFEFPMVLAPSIVVPILLFINFLLAWRIFELTRNSNKTLTSDLAL